jgi:hypothetical protein
MMRHADKNFLVITSKGYPVGFFSTFVQVLTNIFICERADLIPIVLLRNNWLFWEDDGWHGASNPWEYYFKPVSEYSIEDVTDIPSAQLECCRLLELSNMETEVLDAERCAPDKDGSLVLPDNVKFTDLYRYDIDGYPRKISDALQVHLRDIVKRRIVIRDYIIEKVERFVTEHFGSKTIGLHMRGEEHGDEYASFLRMKMLPLHFYFREVDKYLAAHPDAKIFVATDTKSYLRRAKERYGNRVVHYDSTLSDNGQAPHKQFGGAKVGEDVLIDCLLLSMCDFMVHGLSHVTAVAHLFNPDLKHVDVCGAYGRWARLLFYLSKEPWLLWLYKVVTRLVRNGSKLYWLQKRLMHMYFRDPSLGFDAGNVVQKTKNGRETRWALIEPPQEQSNG